MTYREQDVRIDVVRHSKEAVTVTALHVPTGKTFSLDGHSEHGLLAGVINGLRPIVEALDES